MIRENRLVAREGRVYLRREYPSSDPGKISIYYWPLNVQRCGVREQPRRAATAPRPRKPRKKKAAQGSVLKDALRRDR